MTLLCLPVTLNPLHLFSLNFRLTFLELSSKFLRSLCKGSASVSELIVLKIIPNKVIGVSLLKCYDLVRRPNYCQNQKEKLESRHCNDVWETLIYQRQNVGSRAFGATRRKDLFLCAKRVSSIKMAFIPVPKICYFKTKTESQGKKTTL